MWRTLLASLLTLLVALAWASGTGAAAHARAVATAGHPLRRVGDTAHSSTSTGVPLTLRVDPASSGPRFADGAVGLSIETDELATPDLSGGHESLVALMRLLGPGVLRIGGNSLDTSWWTSADEPAPAWATGVITPSDLVRLGGLLRATHWSVILGVDLGHFDPTRAADEAGVATRILGSRLLGFEVGNESDLYGTAASGLRPSTYSVQDYLQELATYTAALRAQAPAMRLYGPDVSQVAWLPAIAADTQTSIAVITEHFYPTTYSFASPICPATSVPSAADLISRRVRKKESAELRALTAVGKTAHLEVRISETNSTGSCDANGGPDTSPVFASALWALDWSLRSASVGVSGVNFHGWLGLCGRDTVSPVCASSLLDEFRGEVAPRPEYYGLLAARQLEGGHFIGVQIRGAGGVDDVTAYATLHADDTITLAVENPSTVAAVAIALRVPGYARAFTEALIAPSINATQGVTFGGASFSATGGLRPKRAPTPMLNGRFRLRIAPASACIVTLYR